MDNIASSPRPPATRRATALGAIESPTWQLAGVALATFLIVALHWQNDGLWFQGDAPRHAMNGFLFRDMLAALPSRPLSYALSYYARYPVISIGAYPPLFHLVEALGFWLVAPSPYVAKAIVVSCASIAGFYTMQWGRRWISPMAGWAGVCAILTPGFVRYSNVVLLNVPSTALGLAALYHFHAWLDTGRARDRTYFVWLTIAATLTYYPGALVLPIAIVWTLWFGRRASGRFLWALVGFLAIIVLMTAITLPTHLARQFPTLAKLVSPVNWSFYGRALVALLGTGWSLLALLGVVTGLATSVWRKESGHLILACVTAIVALAFLPARDERYALLLGPLAVLVAFLAITPAFSVAGRVGRPLAAGLVFAMLAFSARSSSAVPVPAVSGIDEVARYLKIHGPADAVLYSGFHDGVFGFYMRALDPGFERRLVLSTKLLYRYQQDTRFVWVETPYVSTPAEVVSLIQTRSGCRWVAVEVGGESQLTGPEWLLRQALAGPEFEPVRSFPVHAGPVTRVDLYRVTIALDQTPPVDLVFPSFSAQVFRGIEPIARRH